MPSQNKISPPFFREPTDELEAYLTYLNNTLRSGPPERFKKAVTDAIKVVNCFRFIKANESFIRYAFNNPDDKTIYTEYPRDKENHVLRDFDNTSFHIFRSEHQDAEAYLTSLKVQTSEFEGAIKIAREYNKLKQLTRKTKYDKKVGCLDERTSAAINYSTLLTSLNGIDIFEDLLSDILQVVETDSQGNLIDEHIQYLIIFDHFKPYFGGRIYSETKKQTLLFQPDSLVEHLAIIRDYRPPTSKIFFKNTAQEALEIIRNENAVVKTMSFSRRDDTNLEFISNQLADPAKVRPCKKLESTVNRTQILDTKTGIWKTRTINGSRGRPKPEDWEFTKKEAVSLLPSNANMELYQQDQHDIGFLFDVRQVYVKEKYVFRYNQATNQRWWLGPADSSRTYQKTESLDSLRQYLRKNQNGHFPVAHTELLVGLSLKALKALIVHNLSNEGLLKGIVASYHLTQKLGCYLPILLFQRSAFPSAYSSKDQLLQIRAAQNNQRLQTDVLPFDLSLQTLEQWVIEGQRLEIIAAIREENSSAESLLKTADAACFTADFIKTLSILQEKHSSLSFLQELVIRKQSAIAIMSSIDSDALSEMGMLLDVAIITGDVNQTKILLNTLDVFYYIFVIRQGLIVFLKEIDPHSWSFFFNRITPEQSQEIIQRSGGYGAILEALMPENLETKFLETTKFLSQNSETLGKVLSQINGQMSFKYRQHLLTIHLAEYPRKILNNAAEFGSLVEKMPEDFCQTFFETPSIAELIRQHVNNGETMGIFLSKITTSKRMEKLFLLLPRVEGFVPNIFKTAENFYQASIASTCFRKLLADTTIMDPLLEEVCASRTERPRFLMRFRESKDLSKIDSKFFDMCLKHPLRSETELAKRTDSEASGEAVSSSSNPAPSGLINNPNTLHNTRPGNTSSSYIEDEDSEWQIALLASIQDNDEEAIFQRVLAASAHEYSHNL